MTPRLLILCLLPGLAGDVAAAVSAGPDQVNVAISAGAEVRGTPAAPGNAVRWEVIKVPNEFDGGALEDISGAAANFPDGSPGTAPRTSANPTRVEFSHFGTYILRFTDLAAGQSDTMNITVTRNPWNGDGDIGASRLIRIMPIGDSITHGDNDQANGGYRFKLQDRLAAGGYLFDFIGGRHFERRSGYDPDHEGHPGWAAGQFPNGNSFGWAIDIAPGGGYTADIASHQPDLVLLMMGTNDYGLGGATPQEAANAIRNIGENVVWSVVPNARIIVALLEQRSDSTSIAIPAATWFPQFNGLVASQVATWQSQGRRVSTVDMAAALDWPADFDDGIHPNPAGFAKMAQAWYDAIVAVGGGTVVFRNGFE